MLFWSEEGLDDLTMPQLAEELLQPAAFWKRLAKIKSGNATNALEDTKNYCCAHAAKTS